MSGDQQQEVECEACGQLTSEGLHVNGQPLCETCYSIAQKRDEHGLSYLYGKLSEQVRQVEIGRKTKEELFQNRGRLRSINEIVKGGSG